MLTYLTNILQNPFEPKYRAINTQNRHFAAPIGQLSAAVGVLRALGFKPSSVWDQKKGSFLVLLLADDGTKQLLRETCVGLGAGAAALMATRPFVGFIELGLLAVCLLWP
jgi:hypothetical protein